MRQCDIYHADREIIVADLTQGNYTNAERIAIEEKMEEVLLSQFGAGIVQQDKDQIATAEVPTKKELEMGFTNIRVHIN